MTKMNIAGRLIGFTLLLSWFPLKTKAQIEEASELFRTLEQLDSTFFERGFNQCDIEYLDKTVSNDLRFYHDQSGFQDKKSFLENTKTYLCSTPEKKPIRKLQKGSLEVFPLYNNGALYGAVQNGVHHFYLREKGQEDVQTGSAQFTHVWTLENESWILTEVLSYDN